MKKKDIKIRWIDERVFALRCKDFANGNEAINYLYSLGWTYGFRYLYKKYVRFIWETIRTNYYYNEQETICHYIITNKGGRGASLCYIFEIR